MGGYVLHLILQLCLAALVHSQPQCIMITPSVLRVDSEETVAIEVYNQNSPIYVVITVQDFPRKTIGLFTTKIILNAGNGFLGTAQITVPSQHLKKDSKQKQFVYVTAVSDAFKVEKVVLVSVHSGFIFIQTAQTIYTPGSTVLYRIFNMGNKLQPVNKKVIVEFQNPQGITVKRQKAQSTFHGMISQSYMIPEIVSFGTWTIVTRYEDAPQRSYNTQFDVKEFVLPRFEVKLEPEKKFFYVDESTLRVDITARFLFGKPVNGVAFVIFGVVIDGEKKSIPRSLGRVQIVDGHGWGILVREMLSDRFRDLNELLGESIYVSVTVLTESGSDMVEAEQSDIRIVTSPYEILLTKTPKYFKPGMPFQLTLLVTKPDGSPASGIPVRALYGGAGLTRKDGTTKLTINTAATIAPLIVDVETASPLLPHHRQAKARMVADPYRTPAASKNYLHLEVSSGEARPGEMLHVNFYLRNDDVGIQNQIKYFTYLIMSKGTIYKVGRQARHVGQSLITMALIITSEFIPSFRIVAYYYVANEIVADSVWVHVTDSCIGTLEVSGATEKDNRVQQPGTRIQLQLRGSHKALVGLVAVEKGVNDLNEKHKISQSKFWESVERNDVGCTPGGGADNMGVFSDAGLALEASFKTSTPQRTEPLCPQPGKRLRRSPHEYEGENESDMDEDDVILRNMFPESWLWTSEYLSAAPDKDGITTRTLSLFLPDSITTWEILAVSISENGAGICVAEPYAITVMKDFFIDLQLPYSAQMNEEVEIRALLHNYQEHEIRAQIKLIYNPKICSASSSKKRYKQELRIPAQSSRVVPFVLVPLEIGLHNIALHVHISESFTADRVEKKLHVVAQGTRVTKTVTVVTLDPAVKGKDGVQEEKIKAADLMDKVLNTDSVTIISIQGNPVRRLTENSIDGATLGHLIVMPQGNGESNMITMTAAVIATHYLDNTAQWERLGVNRRSDAIKCMEQGYTQQLIYRKADYSYAVFTSQPSSTWLTAYVVKVFAMANNLIATDQHVLCGAVKWLILEKQKADGIFQEDVPVLDEPMVGGYRRADPEASLTAFVLIAIEESKHICGHQVHSLSGSILKAADYLARVYPTLTKPYSVAITAYALAMANKLPEGGKLMDFSTGGTHWKDASNNLFSIEATSYALLALLRTMTFEKTGAIVRWLTEQKFFGDVIGSTQATIMMFQALAQYGIDTSDHKELKLDVSMQLPGRSYPIKYMIDFEHPLLLRSAETKLNQDFTVRAMGEGQATLTVEVIYNANMPKVFGKITTCNMFDLSVTVKADTAGKKPEGALSTLVFEVCIRYLGTFDSTFTLVDIGMLTGFFPDVDDLRRLSESVDRYISKFEIEKGLSDKGRLIVYLDQVSHKESDCLTFRVHQYFSVALIQPAAVTVYEYYALDNRCTKFYHPDKEGGHLRKICQGDVCRCAEGKCYMQESDSEITWTQRIEKACEPEVDYVYKTRLTGVQRTDSYDIYSMTINEVLQQGSNETRQAKIRRFIRHQKCRDLLKLEVGKDYLIWGLRTDVLIQPEDGSYVINEDTWIEWWPNEVECQQPQYREICTDFRIFYQNMKAFGCPN